MTKDRLPTTGLPPGFVYPRQFLRILELGLTNLEPWYILDRDQIQATFKSLKKNYSQKIYMPFARRQDNDDIACWSQPWPDTVLIVHDFASAGWEVHDQFSSFYDWFRKATEDLIEFDDA